ncbi:MAG: heme A synthase, partial [Candidatus Portiera sp.]|nr:heme A synthase [Portiera sp.]
MKILTAAALLLTFLVIVLGAYTRLKDAGLGCPDWPGCYGTLTVPQSAEQIQDSFPDVQLNRGKAWIEVAHRMVAGSLGLFVFLLTFLDFRASRRHKYKMSRILIFASLMVVGQSLLGMWTVTLQLLPQVVTAHLFGGLTILSLLFLRLAHLHLNPLNSLGPHNPEEASRPEKNSQQKSQIITYGYVGLALVIMQIFLGGWVSTNYASLACTDFPLCNGEWVPPSDFGSGFNLLHPIGENYEGGVLNDSAQVAIHWAHRVGALLVT